MEAAKGEATAIPIESSSKSDSNLLECTNKPNLDDVYNDLLDVLESAEKKLPRSTMIAVAIEIVVLLGLCACLAATHHAESIKHKRFLNYRMSEWMLLLIIVVSGFSFIRFLTYIVSLPITRWSRWRIDRNLLFFVMRAKTNTDVMLWLAMILAAWYTTVKPGLDEKGDKGDRSVRVAVHLITGLLVAIALGSFLWLIKNLLYLKLEADLHYNQLFDRIQRTLTDFHVIHLIYVKKGSSSSTVSILCRPENHSFWLDVFKMERETAPLWIVRQLAHSYLSCMEQESLPGLPGDCRDEQKLVAIAKAMLDQLTVGKNNRDVSEEDLLRIGFQREELPYLLQKINTDGDEERPDKISGHEFMSWAVTAYRSCLGLQRTLMNSKTVFIKLNRLMNACVIIIVLVIWLLISQIVTTAQLALLFSPFLAASFIFGESCKKMFDGLIFAFSIHPFDIGDRVVIDGMQMKVTELNILTSVFFKYDTQEEIVYPNSLLMEKNVANLDIMPDQHDCLEFTIHRNTPVEDIKELELKIIKYLEDDSADYGPSKVVKKALVGEKQIRMAVYFKYILSYLSAECRAVRKSRILTKIIEFCKEMENSNNLRPHPSSKKPDIEEFSVKGQLNLDQINKLKEDVMRCVEASDFYREYYSKVVIKEITKEGIKMTLYLRQPMLSAKDMRRSKSIDPKEIKDKKEEMKEKSEIVNQIKSVIQILETSLTQTNHI